jgi:hypothetical protein
MSNSPAYPLSNAKLLDTIRTNAAQGQPYTLTEGLLKGLGYTSASIKQQLGEIGYTQAQIKKITTAGPNLLKELGSIAFLPVSAGVLAGGGAAAEGAAGGAAAGSGAANAAANGASNLLKPIAQGLAWAQGLAFLTSGQNWIRLLEVIAGTVLIVMGLHQLTGVGGGAVTVAKTAGKAALV